MKPLWWSVGSPFQFICCLRYYRTLTTLSISFFLCLMMFLFLVGEIFPRCVETSSPGSSQRLYILILISDSSWRKPSVHTLLWRIWLPADLTVPARAAAPLPFLQDSSSLALCCSLPLSALIPHCFTLFWKVGGRLHISRDDVLYFFLYVQLFYVNLSNLTDSVWFWSRLYWMYRLIKRKWHLWYCLLYMNVV